MRNKAFDHSKYARWIDPAKVVPYERNAKKHDEKQIRNIVNSIKRLGWQKDTVITSDNVLVIGHGRRLAALKIGCEMPYHVIDKTADELTDEDIRELRIADNQTNAETGLDFDLLGAEIGDLSFEGFVFDFGVQIESEEEHEHEAVEDDYDDTDLPEEPKTKLGDIYALGKHRLICGDSIDANVIERLMDGARAELCLTDPPYGINVVAVNKIGGDKPFGSQKGSLMSGSAKYKGKNKIVDCNEYAPIIGDDTTETAKKNFEIVKSFSKNQIIFGGNYFTDFLYPSRCWIVWG